MTDNPPAPVLNVLTVERPAKRERSGWLSTKMQITLIFAVIITGGWGSLDVASRAATFDAWCVAMCALSGTYGLFRTGESFKAKSNQGEHP